MLLALSVLTDTFYFIPKTVLAAVIIAAMIAMNELHEIIHVYRTRRFDVVPCLATFFFSLWLGLEFGILIGIGINASYTLFVTSRPAIRFDVESVSEKEFLLVTPDQSLMYSSAEYFQMLLIKKSTRFSEITVIVIDGAFINFIDSTTAKVSIMT